MINPATILIVDDIEANRILLKNLVVHLGHNPILAENGLTALEHIKKKMPDIVLLDILMPEMDGHEVLDSIKSDEKLRSIPVIMITALDDIKIAVQCIEKGADDYLTKPFNPTLLKARINGCLEKKKFHDKEQQLHVELEENHKALEAAEQTRDAMVQMAVHDLRGPLQVILGYTQILRTDLSNNNIDIKEFSRQLQQIDFSAEEMKSLAELILDASKLEAGEMNLSIASVNASKLIKNLYDQFSYQIKKRKINFMFESESDSTLASADKVLLTRILQNLLTNAFKYTAACKKVSLSVKKEDGNILFSVTNDGSTIPEHYRDKIFDKFFQIEIGDERKKYGVGLGLAFCKMAVEAQGGKIWVESEEGKGTSFKVALKESKE